MRAVLALPPRLAADLLPADLLARLERVVKLDPTANLQGCPDPATLLADADILLTGWDCPVLDADLLRLAPELKAVVHAAGSVKHHVTPAVYAAGIAVSSAADANARPVAEYTLATLILAAKRAFASGGHAHVPGQDSGLTGCTVGVVGASRIGRLVIRMLAGYDVRVLVTDPTADHVPGATLVDLDTLCARSDIVTVHAPQLPETYHLLDDRRLGLLRDGAIVINTARGSLIDTSALTRHCAAGRLDAVLDVTDPEPLPSDHPLRDLPNVFLTPHLAGVRGRELRLLGAYAVAEIERLVAGEPLLGAVHLADLERLA